jgi:hypothetical protein
MGPGAGLAEFGLELAFGGDRPVPVHALLDEPWQKVPGRLGRISEATWRGEFAAAAAELVADIVRHACPPVGDHWATRLVIGVAPDAIGARFTDRGLPCEALIAAVPRPSHPTLRRTDRNWVSAVAWHGRPSTTSATSAPLAPRSGGRCGRCGSGRHGVWVVGAVSAEAGPHPSSGSPREKGMQPGSFGFGINPPTPLDASARARAR